MRGVEIKGDKYVSESREPWMVVVFNRKPPDDIWLEFVFESDFSGEPVRPLLRALAPGGETNWILPAPVLGRAVWYGRSPQKVDHWMISPVNREGEFNFRIISVRSVSLARRLALCGRTKSIFLGLFLSVFKSRREADVHFRRRLMSARLSQYRTWLRKRRRTPEWDSFDLAIDVTAPGQQIRFVRLENDSSNISTSTRTLRSRDDVSMVSAASNDSVTDILDGIGDGDYVAIVRPGDEWLPDAARVVRAALNLTPVDILYADEEISGATPQPWLKPAWDPVLARTLDVTGRARLFSVAFLRAHFADASIAKLNDMVPSHDLLVRHLPRILLRTSSIERRVRAPLWRPAVQTMTTTVIIPTRDRVELLQKCVAGLQKERGSFQIFVVDNDSREERTRSYFEKLRGDKRVRVLSCPGPFNFSKLCNEAARLSQAHSLLLLNNDIETIDAGWLGKLMAWTSDPEIGAAAPKLLYPDGTLQHGGVILGVEGVAGHFEYGLAGNDPGYFGRLNVPFSVSAVTGACLAVSREKYFAVGGLDEVNFPVELNDIDFCLRLAERRWRNVLDGGLRLVHHESASRGRTGMVQDRYPREWALFRDRWRSLLRSDPAFSPALSLESTRPALG